MTSQTMSAVVHITICLSVFYNINALTSETSPTHLSMSVKNSERTTLSPTLDVTNSSSNNVNTTPLNTTELSLSSTSTLPPSSTPAATTQNTVNVSEPSTVSVAATSALQSTIPLTGSSGSTENRTELKTMSTQTNAVTSTLSTQKEPTSKANATDPTTNFTIATTPLSDADKQSLKYSEIILTSIFSTILVIVVLVILAYSFKKCLGPRSQYSHHPLRETSFDSADQYAPPDDTLVISGGLYDAPRIYNPNMTVLEEDETQNDFVSFNSRSGQFRLEFLPGDKDLDPSFNRSHRKNV